VFGGFGFPRIGFRQAADGVVDLGQDVSVELYPGGLDVGGDLGRPGRADDGGGDVPVLELKGGNTLSNSRELVIAAVNVTLPDASADIPHLTQRPYCLPLSA
jgi:hypothetical protein